MKLVVFPLLVTLLLSACSYNQGRYNQKNDSTPVRIPTSAELHDAIPRIEKPSRGGNKTYSVFGKQYQVLKSAKDFEQTGIASWYGNKFHGHLTSNGEIYDMYSMSAAHKNLPLPTYVKVTNLANNKSTIVRVNDRGPFHQDRVIDLSYSAAYKLDILKTGTAKVHIEAIEKSPAAKVTTSVPAPAQPENQVKDIVSSKKEANKTTSKTAQKTLPKPTYIQVFATKNLDVAKATTQKLTSQLTSKISSSYKQKVIYPYSNGIFRIFVGPITQLSEQTSILAQLKKLGYANAYVKAKIN